MFISGESLQAVIFLWLIILLFFIDVNDVCASILIPTYEKFLRDCRGLVEALASVNIVCLNFKPLRHKVTSVSNMYAANPCM